MAQELTAEQRYRAALEAIIEAGRMSDQPRARYCAAIAKAAIRLETPLRYLNYEHAPDCERWYSNRCSCGVGE